MRASFLAVAIIATLTSFVAADWRSDYPDCAQVCFHDKYNGHCANADLPCYCRNNDTKNRVKACMNDNCPADKALKARTKWDKAC